MATVIRYVNTAAAAGGDGTTANTGGASRAYSTLAEWEAAEQEDAVAANNVHFVYCLNSAQDGEADPGGCVIDGWVLNGNTAMTIEAHSTANGAGRNYGIEFDKNAFYSRRTTVAWAHHIGIGDNTGSDTWDPTINVNYFQAESAINHKNGCVYANHTHTNRKTTINVTGCRHEVSSSGTSIASYGVSGQHGNEFHLKNCISDGRASSEFTTGKYGIWINSNDTASTVYNCLVNNMGEGVGWGIGGNGSNRSIVIKNTVVMNCTDDFRAIGDTIDFCASDDGDGTNAIDWTSEATDWNANFTDYYNSDFSIKDENASIWHAGENQTADSAIPSTDIRGVTRPSGANPVSIGPFDFQTEIVRYVNTASSGGDGTTNETSGATAAYSSISTWNTGEDTDLVAAGVSHTVYCSGGEELLNFTISSNWNVNADNTLTIATNPNSNTGRNYSTTFSRNHYYIKGNTNDCFRINDCSDPSSEGVVNVVDMQLDTTTRLGFIQNNAPANPLRVNLVRCRTISERNNDGQNDSNPGRGFGSTGSNCFWYVYNGVFQNSTRCTGAVSSTNYVYNCTFTSNYDYGYDGRNHTVHMKNCLLIGTFSDSDGNADYEARSHWAGIDGIGNNAVVIIPETELVSNPSFDTDTVWTKGTGWSITGGSAVVDGTQTANTDISQTLSTALKPESLYIVRTGVWPRTAGLWAMLIGGKEVYSLSDVLTAPTSRAARMFRPGTENDDVVIRASANGEFTVGFVTIYDASNVSATVVDFEAGDFSIKDTGSQLYQAGLDRDSDSWIPAEDILGNPRPTGANPVSIGAFEFVEPPHPRNYPAAYYTRIG